MYNIELTTYTVYSTITTIFIDYKMSMSIVVLIIIVFKSSNSPSHI